MARTPLKNQPWKSAAARITGLPTECPAQSLVTASVEVPGLDMRQARIVWEARDQEPAFGSNFRFRPLNRGLQWVEVEAQLPDGRRVFAATNFTCASFSRNARGGFLGTPPINGSLRVSVVFSFGSSPLCEMDLCGLRFHCVYGNKKSVGLGLSFCSSGLLFWGRKNGGSHTTSVAGEPIYFFKMRLLFVHEGSAVFGGAEGNVRQTAKELGRRGHTLGLLHGTEMPKHFNAECPDFFSRCFAIPKENNRHLVQASLQEFRPDLVYVHKMADLEVLETLLASSVPQVRMVHDHDIYCMRGYKYNYLSRKICTRPASPHCIFPCGASLARNHGRFPHQMGQLSRQKEGNPAQPAFSTFGGLFQVHQG